jgi:hydroxymethylpyrimidine/phosphomethylpyrimidine kinase
VVTVITRPCVLVFAGHDPSGGAGMQADAEAIVAQGAHALTVITALTVQDNNRVYAVNPVESSTVRAQAMALIENIPISVVKIGIVGSKENALVIAEMISALLMKQPQLPVIVDPVLGSGHGNALNTDDPVVSLAPLLKLATIITPNLPEIARLIPHFSTLSEQAIALLQHRCTDVLIKGGHGAEMDVQNAHFNLLENKIQQHAWSWQRLDGEFHGSGCTLASALAGRIAIGNSLQNALNSAQEYTQSSLQTAYAVADGQFIPNRIKIQK